MTTRASPRKKREDGDGSRAAGRHSRAVCEKARPELPFDGVAAAVAYYRDVLGFRINYQQDGLGVNGSGRHHNSFDCPHGAPQRDWIGEVFVEDADSLYKELQTNGAKLDGPPVSHPGGLREFKTVDPEGNRIAFAQTFE